MRLSYRGFEVIILVPLTDARTTSRDRVEAPAHADKTRCKRLASYTAVRKTAISWGDGCRTAFRARFSSAKFHWQINHPVADAGVCMGRNATASL